MRKYDEEFKQQVLKKVFDGQSVASVSRELGARRKPGSYCRRQGDALDNGRQGLTGAEQKEIVRLKKRMRELEQENEILKKAALIFGRRSKDVTFLLRQKKAITRLNCCAE